MAVNADPEIRIARIAAAVGDAARSRMLYSLMSGQARTATELALIAEVTPATASAHLQRLMSEHLVRVMAQGRHRYYSLDNERVADMLESLNVLAGRSRHGIATNTPDHLRLARTCYDHLAGTLGVALHDRLFALGWLASDSPDSGGGYAVTGRGETGLMALGVDVPAARELRRRFAYACLDWSERRPHVGGAIGAALLEMAHTKKWIAAERDSRAIRITALGRRELARRLGVSIA